jgi:Tfp pilus assembly protein PilV
MKTPNNIRSLINHKTGDEETGFSLVETLVGITLAVIVIAMALTFIITNTKSTARFTQSSATQDEVIQGTSVMQRDISLATKFTLATSNQISFDTRQAGKDYEVSIFHWNPASTAALPDRVVRESLPDYSAIIENRYDKLSGKNGITILVKGYDPNGYLGRPLFSYYDAANSEITMTNPTQAIRDDIMRVEYRVSAKSEGRKSQVQIESSATPAYSTPPGVAANNVPIIPSCPANLVPSITARETQATLRWAATSGATSYTLYRYNYTANDKLEKSWVIPNPGTTSFIDSGLVYGNTYRYAIQSAGPAGTSSLCTSNQNATVVPEPTDFVNLNPAQQSLSAIKVGTTAESLKGPALPGTVAKSTTNILPGKRYTVARDLTNQLAWEETKGATTYRIYETGGTTPVASVDSGTFVWQDTTPTYGATKSYVVRAVNAGGESASSATITLISPPAAPRISAVAEDPTTQAKSNNAIAIAYAANTIGVKMNSNVSLAAAPVCSTTYDAATNSRAGFDDSVGWGTSACYNAVPYNDAGDGDASNDATALQRPSVFNITKFSNSGTFLAVDYNEANRPAGTQCWVSDRGLVQEPCDSTRPHAADNKVALGMYGKNNSSDIALEASWAKSIGAEKYGYQKNREATRNTNLGLTQSTLTNAAAWTTSNDIAFSQQAPGTGYNLQIRAIAANGRTRDSNIRQTMTTPDVPSRVDRFYQTRASSTAFIRNVLDVSPYVRIGNANRVNAYVGPNMTVIGVDATTNAAAAQVRIPSSAYNGGQFNGGAYSSWTTTVGSARSFEIAFSGESFGPCNTPCGTDFGTIPEAYPNYFSGGHYRYWVSG